jgi:hypothetical protein
LGSLGGNSPSEEHELPNEIVKRGPQVVSELSDNEPETGIGHAGKAEDIFAAVAIELTDNAAIFLVKPREEDRTFVIERGQVLVRSFKTPVDGL